MASVLNTFTDRIAMTYSGNGGTVSAVTGVYTGAKDAGVAVVVPAGSVNLEIDITFPHATIQAMCLAGSQPLTVKSNSASVPGDTINLTPTAGSFWGADFANACPITADVTKLFVSNPGAVDSTFNVRVLYN